MKKVIFIIFLVVIFLGGCATVSKSNLYWGKYSHTLYQVKKNPGERSKNKHQEELQIIVKKSKEMNLKVPPGVYAELGMYSKQSGDHSAADNYFRMEQEEYPEFNILMKSVLSN